MDEETLQSICKDVVQNCYPDKANNYRLGKTGLMGLFVGEVMKRTNGNADAKMTTKFIKFYLDNPML